MKKKHHTLKSLVIPVHSKALTRLWKQIELHICQCSFSTRPVGSHVG